MSILETQTRPAQIDTVQVSSDELIVDLTDGRTILVPIEWYPRLLHGTENERCNLRLVGAGTGIHWPDLDEDISLAGIIEGRPSGESSQSLSKWLKSRSTHAV